MNTDQNGLYAEVSVTDPVLPGGIFALLRIAALTTLLLLGVRTLSELLVRSTDRAGKSRSVFLRSMLLASLTLSRPVAVLHLLGAPELPGNRGRDNEQRTAHIISGLRGGNLGSVVPLIVLAFAMLTPSMTVIGLVFLAVALTTRIGMRTRRGRVSDALLGVGLFAFAAGELPARAAALGGTVHLLGPIAMVGTGVVAIAAAWLIGSSLAVHAFLLAVLSQSLVSLPVAVSGMLMANIGGALAGASPSRFLRNHTVSIPSLQIALNGLVLLFGLLLLVIERRIVVEIPDVIVSVALFVGAHLLACVPLPGFDRLVQLFERRRGRGRSHAISDGADDDELHFVPFHLPDAVAVNLAIMHTGLCRMGEAAAHMVMIGMNACQLPDDIEVESGRTAECDNQLEQLQRAIAHAVSSAIPIPCSHEQAHALQQHHGIAMELRAIGLDIIKLLRVLERTHARGYRMHKHSNRELFDISARVLDFLRYNIDYLEGRIDHEDPELAASMEDLIDSARDKLRKRSRKTLEKKSREYTRGELAFLQAVSHLEHVGDRCMRISGMIATKPGMG